MRKIVDSNFLQNPLLNKYLADSINNYAVLIDYAAMEAYKGNTLKSIDKSISILSKYTGQVIILKSTLAISGIKAQKKGMQKRFIDAGQTRDFKSYCTHLNLAMSGDLAYQKAILNHGHAANEHMELMTSESNNIIASIEEIASSYSNEELRTLRKNLPISNEVIERIITDTLIISAQMFEKQANIKELPKYELLPYSYIFRYSLCSYLLIVDWIASGGAKGVKPERFRNDVIDMHFVAFGTVFDGLLTNDTKAKKIYAEAKLILKHLYNA